MTLGLVPYLFMDGNAREAISFYEQVLGARTEFVQAFEEMPANPDFPLPEAAKGLIAHAMLSIGESALMLSDSFPGNPPQQGTQVTLCIMSKDKERSRTVFEALQQGGQVQMPLQETFFSPAYGTLTDKFGVTFHISTEAPQP